MPCGIERVDQQGTAHRTFRQGGQVVHPAVVGACIAPPDDHQGWGFLLHGLSGVLQFGQQAGRRQVDASGGGAQQFMQAGHQRAEIEPSLCRLHPGQIQLVWPMAQRKVQQSLRSMQACAGTQDGGRLVSKLAPYIFGEQLLIDGTGIVGHCKALRDGGQAQQGLPLGMLTGRTREHGRTEPRMVHPRHLRVGHVVVKILQGRRTGEDDIRVARGLVQVDVHADHEFQAFEGTRQPSAIGRRQYRVGGQGDQRADLAFAGCLDFLSQAGDRHFPHYFLGLADACGEASGHHAAPPSRLALGVGGKRGGLRKHRATGLVQMAGQDVQHIDQPG
jgi:hypothetical protein